MDKKCGLLLIGTLLLAGGPGMASDAAETPVYLEYTAKDPRAKSFIYELKEHFRQAGTMRLVPLDQDALYQLRVVALDISDKDAIAYSAVWTLRQQDGLPGFKDQVVGLCPGHKLSACARSIVADTDEQIEEGAKFWAEALKDLDLSKFQTPQQ